MDLRDLHDAHAHDEPPRGLEQRLWHELAPKLNAPVPTPVLKTAAAKPWLAVVGAGAIVSAIGVLSLPAPVAPRVVPSAPRVEAPRAPRVVPPVQAPVATSTLGEETALIGEAQRALRDHAPARALTATQRHADTFQDGVLTQEREGLAAIARCQLHRKDAAEAQRAFLQRWPTSPLAPRVRAACP